MKKQTVVFAIITVMIIGVVPAMLAVPPELPPARLPWTGPTLNIGGAPQSDSEDIPYFFYPSGGSAPEEVPIQLTGTISNAGGQDCLGEVQQDDYHDFVRGAGSDTYEIYDETNVDDGWYQLSWDEEYVHGNADMSIYVEED